MKGSMLQEMIQTLPGLYLVLSTDLNIVAASNEYLSKVKSGSASILDQNFITQIQSIKQYIYPDNLDWQSLFTSIKHSKQPEKLHLNNSAVKILILPFSNEQQEYIIIHFDHDDDKQFILLLNALLDKNQQLENTLTEKSRLYAIVESTDDAVISKSLDGTIQTWNWGAENLYGYKASEMIGKNILSLFPSDSRDEYNYILQEIKEGKFLHYLDTARQRKDGSIISVSVTIAPIKNNAGEIIGASSIAKDMTQFKTNQFLRRKNKELESLTSMKTQFIANVSHELRTPLHCILGFSKFLLSEKEDNLTANQKSYMTDIVDAGNYLNQLIDNILNLAKIEDGKIKLNIEQVDFQDLINNVETTFRNLLLVNRLTLTTEINSSLMPVFSDSDKIKQIVYNYLANAIKFTQPNGEITLTVKPISKDYFCISVQDTGIGINKNDINKVFMRFEQLGEGLTKEHVGSGLGLALVRELATILKGRVGVESQLGKGSVFYAILPCRLEVQEEVSNENKI